MTNKEAKEKLYIEWQKFLENNIDYAGISEAYKMAFKALNQEPCNDAISREDVINLKWQGEASEEFLEGYASAIEDARVLPSVTPQEKTGHWIQENSVLRCSICDIGVARYNKYPYCPNCGARMVEPQEREDKE